VAESEKDGPDWAGLVAAYIAANSTDLFLYSGPITDQGAREFGNAVTKRDPRSDRVTLFLTTYGGNAHPAFKMTRLLQGFYSRIRLLVAGKCKSAGTLVAIGAHELAFGTAGELGPLDVQVTKPDEMFPTSSGLDAFEALAIVTEQAYGSFETYMLRLLSGSQGEISTKTAGEIAAQLVGDVFGPIAAQIDPYRLGELSRAMKIGTDYGKRLAKEGGNLDDEAVKRLVEEYPAHGFVIDIVEARELFKNVATLTPEEVELTTLPGVISPAAGGPWALDLGDLITPEGGKVPKKPTAARKKPTAAKRPAGRRKGRR
jgi:hypothetical protein